MQFSYLQSIEKCAIARATRVRATVHATAALRSHQPSTNHHSAATMRVIQLTLIGMAALEYSPVETFEYLG